MEESSTSWRRKCATRPPTSWTEGPDWGFERRQGLIADELIAVAAGLSDARPGQTVVIVVGSSSHVSHRVVGSVTVSLARRSPVPVVIVQ
jgi:nucleotide-binding universal stress UspA family protein